MAKEIYINDQLVDQADADSPVALTYAVNNLAELRDRQAYSTNNFKLPLTQRNRIACGLPDNSAFVGLPPYRKNTAKIVQNGIEVLTNGIAIITETTRDINVQVVSGIVGFFDLIEGLFLKDIDLSDFEHVWNLDNVIASQVNTDGYVWPVIDYGALPTGSKMVNVRQLRPATYRHTLIERIISGAGYTFDGAITADERYLGSLLAFSNDKFEHGASFVDAPNTITAQARSNINQVLSNDDRDFTIDFQDDAGTDPGAHWNGTEYSAATVVKVKAKVKYTIDVRDQHRGGSTPTIQMAIEKWSAALATWAEAAVNLHSCAGDFETVTYTDQILEAEIDLAAGDKIRVRAHSEPDTDRVLGVVFAGAIVDVVYQPGDVIFGQSIQLEATLPNLSQKDFFKDFLQMFGLIVIPDNYKKHLKLVNMQEIYENRYRAPDWTAKFIDREPQVNYTFGEYGVNNYGRFKTDQGVITDTGKGTLVLDNQTLKEDIDLFQSVFAASNSAIRLQGLPVAQIIKIKQPVPGPIVALADLAFTVKTEPRILMDRKQNATLTFTDADPITETGDAEDVNTVSLPYFQSAGLPGLGYDELFTENYPEIKRMLYRPFVLNRPALLKEQDVADIDWTLPIYDKLTAAYYYRNAIADFIDGEICFVSLVKMQ